MELTKEEILAEMELLNMLPVTIALKEEYYALEQKLQMMEKKC